MAKIIGNKPIIVVQGATFDIRRKFDPEVTQNIASVVISCKELGLMLELERSGNGEFIYRLTDSMTSEFEPMQTTYDMTVVYSDGSKAIQTGVAFTVEKRQNPLTEEE